MVVSEVALVVLILIRRKATLVSDQPIDWALGLAGTCSALLVTPTDLAPLAPSGLWLTLILFGMFLQIYAKFALARSFGIIAANRGIKMGGPYALIRHPMYAGYTISHIGFWLAYPSFTNAAIYVTGLGLQIARIIREEALLSRDERYVEFMQRVRYRLLPGVF
jgi:protein-S-isoprenylcysteine O-methyltransferase Ste14